MTATAIVLALLVVVILAAGIAERIGRARRPPPPSLLDERLLVAVVVNLKSGQSFHGVLYASDAHVLVLRNAQAIDPGSPGNTPVDGEVIVLRTEVDFIQRP